MRTLERWGVYPDTESRKIISDFKIQFGIFIILIIKKYKKKEIFMRFRFLFIHLSIVSLILIALIPGIVTASVSFNIRGSYNASSSGDSILSGNQPVAYQGYLRLQNGEISPLTNVTISLKADNITRIYDSTYAIGWTKSSANWVYPPNFTITKSYKTDWFTDTNPTINIPVTITRNLNETIFSQNGYQLVQCNVTFWDLTNVDHLYGKIDNYKRNEVNVTVLRDTFRTDLPPYRIEIDKNNTKQFQFSINDTNEIIIGHPYSFSIVYQIDRVDPTKTVFYKPVCGIELITDISPISPTGTSQTITIPVSLLPPYVQEASASIHQLVSWSYYSQYEKTALLLENSNIVIIPPKNSSGIAIYRPSTQQFIFNTSPITRTTFGLSTDIPITGDWNGDSITDMGVFRPSARQFIFNTAPVTRTTFGLSTDKPITGDWNGDGITDIGVFRPSTRQFIFNTAPITRISFGQSTDIPITGDWNSDSRTDVGVFRPSTRQFIFNTIPVTRTTFGLSTDIPITGDWNGDSITDVGVFRPSTRQFIFNTSPITRITFGLSTDIPITGKWV
jgi:hypothetical protein